MNALTAFESLEGRRFYSASPRTPVAMTGVSAGLRAAAATVAPSISGFSGSITDTGNVRRDATIVVAVKAGSGGALNVNTLKRASVRLYEIDANGQRVQPAILTSNAQTSGGGDTISLTPNQPLKANTVYRFEVNQSYVTKSSDLVRDVAGNAFLPFAGKFTTGTQITIADPTINFSQAQTTASAQPYTGITIGPDHKLYAATLTGNIYRWAINGDGSLGAQETINTVITANGGNRIITGIAFDPNAPSGTLRLLVSHGQYKLGSTASTGNGVQYQADNYTGSISVLTGANLQNYQDLIVHIPRSVKDHMNNQIVFDPSGQHFTFVIAAMNAMGQADSVWGNRPENELSAAMYQVDVNDLNSYVSANGAIDLDPSANYDVFSHGSALRIYADGIRNAFDMVYASNGHLYTATNGSSANGNTPGTPSDLSTVPSSNRLDYASDGAYDGGRVPGLTSVPQTEEDLLLDVQPGKYYGHPNPARGEYVLDAGNVDGDTDNPLEFAAYPKGTRPDRNYTLPAYDLGKNASPDGMIEYHGNAFGGKLNNTLLICRYNSGADILAITPNGNGTISKSKVQPRITGFTGLGTPLDLTEDESTGNIYTTVLDEKDMTGSIMLLKPEGIKAQGTAHTDNGSSSIRLSYYLKPGRSGVLPVDLINTGTTTLVLDRFKLTAGDRRNFVVTDLPDGDVYILPGEKYTVHVKAVLGKGDTTAIRRANLAFGTNEVNKRYTIVQLRITNLAAPARQVASRAASPALRATFAVLSSTSSVKIDSQWWLDVLD